MKKAIKIAKLKQFSNYYEISLLGGGAAYRLTSVSLISKNHMCGLRTKIEGKKMQGWNPEFLVNENLVKNEEKFAVIVLNRKILLNPEITKTLWQKSSLRCLVDGGANQWYRFLNDNQLLEKLIQPDFITGDFDSILEENLSYFKSKSEAIKVVKTPDQSETDFTKSLKVLKTRIDELNIKHVLVLQEFSGRLDQIMSNINTIFKSSNILQNTNVYLISSCSMTWLLEPGSHSIQVPRHLVEQQRWCSLLPVGSESTVTTDGLKWNLSNGILRFGGMVSSSNTYSKERVEITTDQHLVWSMGYFNFDDE